jgi:formate hydrogenlyase transcriptional activator
MASPASQLRSNTWLEEHGAGELEQLFRAIVYHPAAPILITDNDRHYRDAGAGAGNLPGLPREQIIGRSLDDFAEPGFKAHISEIWQDFLERGERQGKLRLVNPDVRAREIAFEAKENILPVRHLVILQDQTAPEAPPWVRDFALFLLDPGGLVVSWYSGAERIYGYSAAEMSGRHITMLYPAEAGESTRFDADRFNLELTRAATDGHFGDECWCMKKDGSRFWGHIITTAVRDAAGELQGFARVVRDFSERRARDQKLRATRTRLSKLSQETAIAGVVSGEFDRIPEVNDAFLQIIGYTREDLRSGCLHWPDLTPPEYFALDELAHEEGLRFGACTPYEKEMIRKDGSRVHVLVATAVLKLTPFRWTSFVQDLSDRPVEKAAAEEDRQPGESGNSFGEIVGGGEAVRRMLALIEVVAPTNATVLILGETGTGKELVARAVHQVSPRRDRPFVTLNCAAIPTGLLESELFGYERGAFTGALTQKIGRFEMAHKGTLFLDEVGDIPIELQPKLLRALQEKAFERLGGTKTIPIDVRLVAATNRNLTQMMGDKLFRSDLYYRLKVFPVNTPALRDHPEDIPGLVRHFVRKFAAAMERKVDTVHPDTMRELVNWQWPGNVRELENFIERCVILSPGQTLKAPLAELRDCDAEQDADSTLEHMEREHVLRVLRETGSSVSKAAIRLGMPRTTLNALMRKLGIERKDL